MVRPYAAHVTATPEPSDPQLHPAEPHHSDIGSKLNWLRAGVLGANDGIVSTAGLVMGVAGANTDSSAILIAGVAGLVVFGLWQVLFTRRGGSALVPPRLFHHASFTFGVILALVYFAAFTSIFFTLSLLWQGGLGHTALESGFLTLPFAIGTAIFSSQSSKWAAKLGRSVLVIGAALVAVGLGATWLILNSVAIGDLNNWMLLPAIFVAGAGNGFFLAPNVQFIVATVENSEAGAASGVVQTMQRVGTAIGVAIIGSILFDAITFGPMSTPQTIAEGFKTGATNAMGMSTILAVVAFALVFSLPKRIQVHGAAAAPVAE